MEKVSAVNCGAYENAREAVSRAIRIAGGMPRKDRALIKVNLLSASSPEEGITTHPEIVKAAILELQKKCKQISVGDMPGFTSLERAARKSGIAQACEETGAELVGFEGTKEYENPHAILAKRTKLFTSAFDFIVNIPKLKTHALTVYTGAVKNLFGFVPPAQRKFYHLKYPDPLSFSRMLLDNYLLIRPGLSIVDGIVGMEGDGPSAGTLRNFNFIAAGRDALAVDVVCASLLGIGNKVPLLQIARKAGIERASLENISIVGDKVKPIADLKLPQSSMFQIPAPFLKIARQTITATPVVLEKKCTGCGTCAKACPADAIRMEKRAEDKRIPAETITMEKHKRAPADEIKKEKSRQANKIPVFDYKKCVRCYTCQEMCPEKAIGLHENKIARVAKGFALRMLVY